jgi:1-aminocyclopropane-1-carboxylate deaminase
VDFKGFDIAKDLLTKEWLQTIEWPNASGNKIYSDILRLDLIHPLVSGNKWLKLKGWLERLNSERKQGIVTMGGPWSNFLHACAYACYINNIPLQVLIKGHEKMQNPLLDDLKAWNVDINFVNRQQFYDENYGQSLANDKNYLWIPLGGDGASGEQGIIRWMNELPLDAYDLVCCASGTGTTGSGIAKGNLAFKSLWVFDPGTGDESVQQKFNELSIAMPERNIFFYKLENKFGKLTPALEAFMKDWYKTTHIPLDLVYTAPMCHTLQGFINNGKIERNSRTLIIHTGGLQGNRSNPALPIG